MPAAIKAARTTHTLEALRALARSGKDATQNAHLPMAPSGLEGVGRAEAGWIVGALPVSGAVGLEEAAVDRT